MVYTGFWEGLLDMIKQDRKTRLHQINSRLIELRFEIRDLLVEAARHRIELNDHAGEASKNRCGAMDIERFGVYLTKVLKLFYTLEKAVIK